MLDPPTYSVLDVGKRGIPKLGEPQMAWLRLIHNDPTYGPQWRHLRWTLVPEDHLPLVVFQYAGQDFDLTYFLVIGDVCNAALDLSEGSVIAISHFDQDCKPSENLTVRGEKALLGWEP
jgi:hypothetical protein